jgi:Ca-activated chloride channel family protein
MWLTLSLLLLQAGVPTFATQVQIVGVTVTATYASSGVPVAGLTQNDFIVLEDGKEQPVIHFEQHDAPASVLVLLDTSVSMRAILPAVREAAIRLIRSLRPADEVHVATFDERYHMLCDFTADREEAVRAIGELREGDETSLHMSLYIASRYLEDRFRDDVERRRILILLSDGEDTKATMSAGTIVDALRRSGVVVYVVHMQRHILGGRETISLTEQAQKLVELLVYETGGRLASVPFPYEPRVIGSVFSDIGNELGTQYHFAYSREAADNRPGWHSIAVTLRSRSDIRLRFRRGYFVTTRR